jgi:uncharacterized protein
MEFRENQTLSRFEAWLGDDLVGEAHYQLIDGVAEFDHTVVPPEYAGQGIAGQLVSYAMSQIRLNGQLTVQPSCPYVADWFSRHLDYADLLASPAPPA